MHLPPKSFARNLVSFAAASCFVLVSTAAFAGEEDRTDGVAADANIASATAFASPEVEAKDDSVVVEAPATAVAIGAAAEPSAAPVEKNAERITGKGEAKDDGEPASFEVQPVRTAPEATSTFSLAPRGSDRVSTPRDKDAFRFGPLAGIGFPRPFAVGVFAKFQRVVGASAEYGFMPEVTIAGAATSFEGVSADLRVFPLKNAFFVGLRGGRQWLRATTTVTAGGGSSLETMEAATWFVNPRVGFLHTFASGVTVGIDVGVQLPIAPSFTRSGRAHEAGLTSETDKALATVANTLGNTTTVTLDLLRVGFLF